METSDNYDDEFEDEEDLFSKTDSVKRLDAEQSPGVLSPGTEMKMRLTNREDSDEDIQEWKEML
jgi:hypothetical protein